MSEEAKRMAEELGTIEGVLDGSIDGVHPLQAAEEAVEAIRKTHLPPLLKRVEELEAKLAKRDEQIAEMARGGEW